MREAVAGDSVYRRTLSLEGKVTKDAILLILRKRF